MIGVTENLRKIQDLLAKAAIEAGRRPESVTLLAASKSQAVQTVLAAAAAGLRDFGENFVQEGIAKIRGCDRDDLIWHFIGHLQSNKTREVAENFDWVHTVDRLKIAERLSAQRPSTAAALNVCIQVDIDSEESKSGAAYEDVHELARAVAMLPNLKLRGLMCIPAQRTGLQLQRDPFSRLRKLAGVLRENGVDTDTLSMGMSGDFEAAIAEGSTMVRIGTALFGPRR